MTQEQAAQGWNSKFAEKEAFSTPKGNGYLCGGLFKTSMLSHRVAWAVHHGEWPKGFIDHINADKTDNRIENLRDVSAAENNRNGRLHRHNASGHNGVYWDAGISRWRSCIKVDGKTVHLGSFKSLDAAVASRQKADIVHGFHPNHGRRI